MASALAPGFYTVTVENQMEQCASAVKVIEVLPAPEEWADAEVLSLTCLNENSASLEVSLEDHYMWDILVNGSDGALIQQVAGFQGDTVLTDLPADNFEVIVISQCGTQYELYDLDTKSPQSVEANFSSELEAINLANSGNATFYNNSLNGVNFTWDFGDGTIDSTNVDGQHLYTEIGLYEVTLHASNSHCSGIFTDIVAVIWNEMDTEDDNSTGVFTLDPDKVTDMEIADLDSKVEIYFGQQNIIVKSQVMVQETVLFQIFNSAGQLVHTEERDEMSSSPIELQIGHLAQGVFYLNILTGDIVLKSEKFLKN
jgi:PKD repeat protein